MGESLTYRLTVPAPVERVFARFTDPVLMAEWIGVAVQLDARPGGALRIDVNGRDVVRGEFVDVLAPRRLRFTWGWEGPDRPVPPGASLVEVTLTPSGDGTLVELRHSGLPDALLDIHGQGWEHYLARLERVLAGARAGDDPKAAPGTRHGS